MELEASSDLQVYRKSALNRSLHDTPKELLITQRSQVQILPPLQNSGSDSLGDPGLKASELEPVIT